jgi:hypothetical protein
MNKDQRFRVGRESIVHGRKVDVPLTVIRQAILLTENIIQMGQVFKERIARLWNGNDITDITEKSEQKRVCFACARGEDDAAGVYADALVFVPIGNSLTSREKSLRIRFIEH